MISWIFIGEVCITKHILFPCSVPTGDKSKPIELSESKRMGIALSSKVKPLKCVTDGSTIYHNLYSHILTSNNIIPLNEFLSSSEPFKGKICDLLKAVGYYVVTYREESEGKKTQQKQMTTERAFKVFPVIVVYNDGVWEHLSLAPYKFVEKASLMINEEYGVGIVEVGRDCEALRPYAYKILLNPTTSVIAKICDLSEVDASKPTASKKALFR